MIERRHLARLQMKCAVLLWNPGDGSFTRSITENLSCGGFSCLSGESYRPGDELEAMLEVPARYRNGRPKGFLTLQCRVEVVRTNGRQSRVGCRIKDYTVIAPSASVTEKSK